MRDEQESGFEFGDETESDSDSRDFDAIAAELAEDASKSYEEQREHQSEFLDTVAEEEGAEVLETECNLIGDYSVSLRAKMDGELMDRMGAIDARIERLENEDGRAYEFSETADDVSTLLADVIDDDEYDKTLFYKVYESEGLAALGALLETAFESLKMEREREEGAAEGFRSTRG